MILQVSRYMNRTTNAAPLAVFRILFGLMMLISIIRFWANGWIKKLYIEPSYFFSYYGFEFVKPIGEYTYLLFLICGIAALGIALGYRYRLSATTFFLSFTYIELMDKTTYLNHYYFISILSFLMIFLPAQAYFSMDAFSGRSTAFRKIPTWSVDSIKLLLSIVYFYAGLAKLNSDWLLQAMPLKIWLPSKYDLPLLGDLLQESWMIYLFSWSGALYDLMIPFLLLYRRTRTVAFLMVIVFHVLTRVLFPIGMFPFIMIVSATIFFDAGVHDRILKFIRRALALPHKVLEVSRTMILTPLQKKIFLVFFVFFFAAQLALPFRHLLYPGELFWTEQGYRFSWRVMLMDKVGYANFRIVNNKTGESFYVDNSRFLTPFQEKQMATQPDFILEYAHFLHSHYATKLECEPQVYVDSYVALNGRRSTRYIDPQVDLAAVHLSLKNRHWILPFNDDIKGL